MSSVKEEWQIEDAHKEAEQEDGGSIEIGAERGIHSHFLGWH